MKNKIRENIQSGFTPLEIIKANGQSCCQKRNSLTGFTLIEVIVALAIAAISLTALLQLSLGSTRLAYRVSREFNALPLAVEEIEEVKNKTFFADATRPSGEYVIKTKSQSESFQDFDYSKITVEVLYKDVTQTELYWLNLKTGIESFKEMMKENAEK